MKLRLFFLIFSLLYGNLIAKTKILGKSRCTETQMKTYLVKKNPKVNKKYLHYVKYYLSEGQKEGVRGDLAFCQSLHETNFFKFGGDVIPQQNNFAGIGTIGGGEKGIYFKTPQEGIRAQIQHLKGKWAFPGYDTKKYKTLKQAFRKHDTYGHKIVNLYNEIKKTKPTVK